jgi:N-acetyl-anhydromuramyl-L-alanine amidase AmpD
MSTIFRKPKRRVDRIFIHCSASDIPAHDSVEVVRQWHFARGFDDIGYHFFIHKNGKISLGRDIERTPAAQYRHNLRNIAICLHGFKKEKFTPAQEKTLQRLCTQINDAYLKQVSFHGHCEVSAKACPVFDYRKVLNLDLYGSLNTNPNVLKNIKSKKAEELPELKLGSRGEAVELLQQLLFIKIDGIFGPQTGRSIKAFKKLHKLYASDLVKNHIWRLLIENKRVEH